eukprot:5878711-Amphidinium_carterae.1
MDGCTPNHFYLHAGLSIRLSGKVGSGADLVLRSLLRNIVQILNFYAHSCQIGSNIMQPEYHSNPLNAPNQYNGVRLNASERDPKAVEEQK